MSSLLTCRPNLEVVDLSPTVRFFRDVLRFTVDLEDEEMGLALLRRDTVGIAVVRTPHPAANETTACYVTVSEVDQLYEDCRDHGATIAVPLTDHPWGLRDFVLEVPGRHRVAFGQPIAPP